MLCGLGALGLGAVTVVSTGTVTAGASTRSLGVITSVSVTFNLVVTRPGHYVTTLRGSGQIDFTHNNGTVVLNLPTGGLHSNQKVAKGKAPPSAPIQLKAEWVNGAAYVSLPPSVASLIGGNPTASYPVPASLGKDLDTSIAQTAVAITYAHLLVDTLVGQHTRGMGTRTMSGVRVSGTAVDLTLSELLKIVPAIGPVMGTALAPMARTAIPVTMWTDSRGRLIQATFTQPSNAKTGLTGTVRFTDFNAPVTIAAPAAGTVPTISKGELDYLESQNPFGAGG